MNKRAFRRGMNFQRPVVEQLEIRTVPASVSIVTVSVTSSGDVRVTGDNNDNSVNVDVSSAGISITGNDGTQVRFGGELYASGEAVVVDANDAIGDDIEIDLKNGDDTLDIEFGESSGGGGEGELDEDGLSFDVDDITVKLGRGDDSLEVNVNDGSVDIDGRVSVDGGAGSDDIHLHVNGGDVNIAEGLTISAGDGSDHVVIQVAGSLDVDGEARISTGNDSDIVELNASGETGIDLGRSLKIDTGNGSDEVRVEGEIDTTRDLDIRLGSDNDAVLVGDLAELDGEGVGVDVGGNLRIHAGSGDDVIAAGAVDVGTYDDEEEGDLISGGDVTIQGEAGEDRVHVENLDVGDDLKVDLGAHDDDLVAIGITVEGEVDVDGSAGNDRISLDGGTFGGDIDVNMGSGDDDLAVNGDLSIDEDAEVDLNGGSGNDDLNSDLDLEGDLDADITSFGDNEIDLEDIRADVFSSVDTYFGLDEEI